MNTSLQGAPEMNRLRFSEYCSRLAPDLVFQYLLRRSGVSRKILSSSMISELERDFRQPAHLQARVDSLSEEARHEIACIYLCGPAGIPSLHQGEFEGEILHSFLAYLGKDTRGGVRYLPFEEFYKGLRKKLASILRDRAECGTDLADGQEWPLKCLSDCAVVLLAAAEKKIQRGKNGTFIKTSIDRIKRLLHGYHRVFRLPAQKTVQDICEFFQAISVVYFHDRNCIPRPGGVAAWFSLSPQAQYTLWLQYYCHTVCDLDLLKDVCANPNEWFVLARLGGPFQSRINDIACRLEYAGLVNLRRKAGKILMARSEACDTLLRNPAHLLVSGRSVITPDFQVLLPQEVSPDTLWCFSRFGRLESLDKVYKGKIERHAVYDACARGVPLHELETALQRWAAPANVVQSIREWVREFERLTISSETILISAEEKVSRAVAGLPGVGEHLEHIDAHAVFRIKEGAEEEVRRRLAELGFDCRRTSPGKEDGPVSGPIGLGRAGREEHHEPVVRFTVQEDPQPRISPRSGKYSTELKRLELEELFQVTEYAIVMGTGLTIDYGGSQGIRRKVYAIQPAEFHRGPLAYITGKDMDTGTSKKLLVEKIKRAGVIEA